MIPRTVNIAGIPVNVISDEEAEKCDLVVCVGISDSLIFPDNLTGPCADCCAPLQWRPHAPKTPPKICMRCVHIRSIAAEAVS